LEARLVVTGRDRAAELHLSDAIWKTASVVGLFALVVSLVVVPETNRVVRTFIAACITFGFVIFAALVSRLAIYFYAKEDSP
jgi:hypothetical protein